MHRPIIPGKLSNSCVVSCRTSLNQKTGRPVVKYSVGSIETPALSRHWTQRFDTDLVADGPGHDRAMEQCRKWLSLTTAPTWRTYRIPFWQERLIVKTHHSNYLFWALYIRCRQQNRTVRFSVTLFQPCTMSETAEADAAAATFHQAARNLARLMRNPDCRRILRLHRSPSQQCSRSLTSVFHGLHQLDVNMPNCLSYGHFHSKPVKVDRTNVWVGLHLLIMLQCAVKI